MREERAGHSRSQIFGVWVLGLFLLLCQISLLNKHVYIFLKYFPGPGHIKMKKTPPESWQHDSNREADIRRNTGYNGKTVVDTY